MRYGFRPRPRRPELTNSADSWVRRPTVPCLHGRGRRRAVEGHDPPPAVVVMAAGRRRPNRRDERQIPRQSGSVDTTPATRRRRVDFSMSMTWPVQVRRPADQIAIHPPPQHQHLSGQLAAQHPRLVGSVRISPEPGPTRGRVWPHHHGNRSQPDSAAMATSALGRVSISTPAVAHHPTA